MCIRDRWKRAWVNDIDKWQYRWMESFKIINGVGRGHILQGSSSWKDYSVSSKVNFPLASAGGLVIRSQGVKRYYSLELTSKNKLQINKMFYELETLKEVNFNLNNKNEPESVFYKEYGEANKLIEEFMLLANKKVASYITRQKKKPLVFRVHDSPDGEKLYNLQKITSSLGYDFNPKRKNINRALNKLLEQCKGKKEQNLIDTLALRSMSKAKYTINNIGHYGLGFDNYTHFTSPIRRYPDVLVHRLLYSYIE